jgi:hypothetical protein
MGVISSRSSSPSSHFADCVYSVYDAPEIAGDGASTVAVAGAANV